MNPIPSPALRSDRTPPLRVVGEEILVRLPSEQTGGALTLVEERTPPGGGPPPHVHRHEDEAYLILEGAFDFLLADRWQRFEAGATVWAPRGVPHTFKNVGSEPGRMIVVISPGGFERFFEGVDELSRDAPPSPVQLADLGSRYGLEFLPPEG